MKRTLRISILAILAFAIILLVRLPASWVKGFLPPGITCADIAGTAWNGSCSGIAYNGAALGNLNWELHPLALFRGKVAGFVNLTRGGQFVRGDFEMASGQSYVAHDLQAQLPLDPPLLPQLDAGYSGNLSVNLQYLRLEKNLLAAIEGQVQATSLYSKRDRLALGGYSATFLKAAAGSEPVAQVSSLEGPVDFEGTLKLTREPGWVVDGKIRTKPETPQALVQQLAYLGAPDAQGFRPLSLAGTF
jgi:general secretion pathway protein N